MGQPKRYLVTSALPYANGPLHIGHIAGAYLPADIYVRYLRIKHGKENVLYVCGSDENGAAITLRAKKEGVPPKEIVDKYHAQIEKAFQDFGIEFDIYHRTSSKLHHETAQEFFLELYKKGVFKEKTIEQFYDEEYEQFLADRYITGACPKCNYDKAFGDQCEKCGSSLSPQELINPKSTLSGKSPVLKETTHWFLPMGDYEKWLKEWLIEGHTEWKSNVYGQCKSWIEGKLQSRAMTRDLGWGVPVPLANAEGKVLYVWLDAPIGYISATKQWAADNGKNWEDYWKSEDTQLIHFIGKDNIVFHCIIFPILLHAHGGFILPENVPANEFLNLEGDKFSTSRNHAVWLHEYLEDFPGREDELRYVLCSIAPETGDSEFTWKDFQARVNNELVNTLGNFVNRVMVLTFKYFNGKVPHGKLSELRGEKLAAYSSYFNEVGKDIELYKLRSALQMAMGLAKTGDEYLSMEEPWKKIKSEDNNIVESVAADLFFCLNIVAHLSIVLEPFLPKTAKKIRTQLNLDESILKGEKSKITRGETGEESHIIVGPPVRILQPGHQLNQPEHLFKRIEDEEIETQIAKLRDKSK